MPPFSIAQPAAPQILIADGSKQAEALFPAIAAFCGLLDVAHLPLLLPALDVLPGQGMSPHAEILAARADALDRLSKGDAGHCRHAGGGGSDSHRIRRSTTGSSL